MRYAQLLFVVLGLLALTAVTLRLQAWAGRRRAADVQAGREADDYLASLREPLTLRPHGLLILDEAPWAQTRLILKGEIEDLPETAWGRAQYSRFLCWRADVSAGISEWCQEIA